MDLCGIDNYQLAGNTYVLFVMITQLKFQCDHPTLAQDHAVWAIRSHTAPQAEMTFRYNHNYILLSVEKLATDVFSCPR